MRGKRLLLLVVLLGLILTLSGCFVKTVDELYTLPRHSDDYNCLEQAIEQVLASQNAVYAAPVSGVNQQSVQLADLDGDGLEEAIAFLKTTSDKPLKAYIFSRADGDYRLMDVIEGDGTSFSSVEYVSLTGSAGVQIVIGRQLSTDVLQSLTVYSYADGQAAELMSTNCSEYRIADLDGDGCKDIFVLRFDAEPSPGTAELYCWKDGQVRKEPEAYLTAGASPVRRILTGKLAQGIPAVFVASSYEQNGLATDVFVFQNGQFRNVLAGEDSRAVSVMRDYCVYAADIDDDGLIELPQVVPLPAADEAEESFYVINWYRLDLRGNCTRKLITYQNDADGWFLILPEEWGNQICITRAEEVAGVRGYELSRWKDGKAAERVVTIYAFTGDDRNETAQSDGRILLCEKGEVTFAAQPGTGQWARELSPQTLRKMFRLVHVDWNSGET